jgi:hypothetical protein
MALLCICCFLGAKNRSSVSKKDIFAWQVPPQKGLQVIHAHFKYLIHLQMILVLDIPLNSCSPLR